MSGSTAVGSQPTYAYDVVGVFDGNFNQLFRDARSIKASIKETAKVMMHPVESGSTYGDHKVIMPTEIDLSVVLLPASYINTYQQIRNVFKGSSSVIIRTTVGFYLDMFLDGVPHEENPEHFDTITMALKFKHIIIATAAKTTAVSTQNGGNKSGKAASGTEASNATEKTQKSSAAYSILFGKGKTEGAEE